MISFKDYLTTTPNIQCDIGRGLTKQQLIEQIHAEPFLFSIPKDEDEKYPGDMVSPGVMHVQRFGKPDVWYVHRRGGHAPIEFRDEEAAMHFREIERNQHTKDLEKIHKKLTDHYASVHANPLHNEAAKLYASSSYLTNVGLMRYKNEGLSPLVHRLDNALRVKSTPDHMVVYSGISSDHASKLDTSDVVHHPAFLSTSLSLPVARGFSHSQNSNAVMKIHVPSGHPGLYVGDQGVGNHSQEREFILPRGMNIRIDRSKEHVLKTQDGDFRLHHCVIE